MHVHAKPVLFRALALLPLAALFNCTTSGDDDDSAVPPVPVPTVVGITDGMRTKATSLALNGTKQANDALYYMVAGASKAETLVLADEESTWTGTLPLNQEGTITVTFVAEDAKGNYSSPVGPFAVTRDTTPPAAPSVQSGCGGVVAQGATAAVTLSGTKATDGDLWLALDAAAAEQKATLDGQGTWSLVLNLAPGTHALAFTSKDDLGNESTPPVACTITVLSALQPPTLDAVTTPTQVNHQVVKGTRQEGVDVVLQVTGGDELVVAQGSTAGTAWTKDLALTEGVNDFQVWARFSGMESTKVPGSITLDTQKPACPVVDDYSPGQNLGTASSITLSFSGTKEAGTTLLRDNTPVTGVDAAATTWSVQIPGVAAGTFTALFEAKDGAGNKSTGCTTVRVDVSDIQAPTINAVTACTHAASQSVGGTKTEGKKVYLKRAGQQEVMVASANGTTWSFSLTNMTDGENRFCVFAEDPISGMRGPEACATIVYTKALVVNSVNSPTNLREVAFSGGKGKGQWVKMKVGVNGTAAEIVAADDSTSWTAAPVPLTEGPQSFVFFGGVGTLSCTTEPVTVSLDVDQTAPAVPHFNPGLPTTTPEASLTAGADRDTSGNVRLRYNPSSTIAVVADREGAAHVTFPVTLAMGRNILCISSMDAVGNLSDEECVTVMRQDGPAVRVLQPTELGIVTSTDITVVAEAKGGYGPLAVTGVNLCVDAHCGAATPIGGTENFRWTYTIPGSSTEFTHDSAHTVKVSATNGNNVTSEATGHFLFRTAEIDLVSTFGVPSDSDTPKLAVDSAGLVHMVWADGCIQFGYPPATDGGPPPAGNYCPESKPGNYPGDIFYRSFNLATGQLSAVKLISDAEGDGESKDPSIALDQNGLLHIVWVESGDILGKGPDPDVVHRTLDPSNGRMGTIEVLSPGDEEERTPVLAVSSNGTLHVAWDHPISGVHEVKYTFKSGASWSAPVVVSNTRVVGAQTLPSGVSQFPALGADSSGCAHLAWQNYDRPVAEGGPDADIFYRKICNGTPEAIKLVSDSALDGDSRLPALAVDQTDTAIIVWKDTADINLCGNDGDIWMRRYPATGGPGAYTLVSRDSATESFSPALAVRADGELVVVWSEVRPFVAGQEPQADLFINATIAGSHGEYFAAGGMQLTNTGGPAQQAAVAVDGRSNVHVVWQDLGSVVNNGTDTDVFYTGVPFITQ